MTLLGGVAASGQTVPPDFFFEDVATGLHAPTSIAWTPDGRMLVAEKYGLVRVWIPGQGWQTQNFLNLHPEVNTFHDRGLVNIAVHPDFENAPFVYLLYVYDHPGAAPDVNEPRTQRVLRVAASQSGPLVAIEGTETVILGKRSTAANAASPSCLRGGAYVEDCIPIDRRMHAGGQVRFDQSGALIVSTGDGWDNELSPDILRSLHLDSLSGKLLRVDPLTGRGLPDNPFFDGDARTNQSRVLSYGLRNPFRFALHPETDEPFVGDVGRNAWEEQSVGRGRNFGWPCYEGGNGTSAPQAAFVGYPECVALAQDTSQVEAPIYAYQHEGLDGAAVAGEFLSSPHYPFDYEGAYFFADYAQEWIKVMFFDEEDRPTVSHFADVPSPVYLAVSPDGYLHYVSIATGRVVRIRYTGDLNAPPKAKIVASPTFGPGPLVVSLSGGLSSDPNGDSLSYSWDFTDGGTSTSETPVHVFTERGLHPVRLTVTDAYGASTSAVQVIAVDESPPTPSIQTPLAAQRFDVGDVVSYGGFASDAEEGSVPDSSMTWSATLHHDNHVHFDLVSETGSSGAFVYPDHGDNTYVELCLSARDSNQLEGRACRDILPNDIALVVESVPSGLQLVYNGDVRTTPFTVITHRGATRQLTAFHEQDGWSFVGWSNGGDRSQAFHVNGTVSRLVAGYEPLEPANAPDLTSSGTGITATYFNNIDLAGEGFERVEPTVSFVWGNDAPHPAIQPDNFSARFEGWIHPRFSETYTFYTETNNGVRLWVDGRLLIEDWREQAPWLLQHNAAIDLVADVPAHVRMEFFDGSGNAEARLAWSSSSQVFETIPQSRLYPMASAVAEPQASVFAAPTSGAAPLVVFFDATGSTSPQGAPLFYSWDFGDGSGGTGATATHTFSSSGSYTVALTVTDGSRSDTATTSIFVDQGVGGTGLEATYYEGPNLTGPALTRVDAGVDFDWGTFSPLPSFPVDDFSVRWRGQIDPPVTGTYTFETIANNGVRLWVGGRLLIDRWTADPPWPGVATAPIALGAGERVDIVLEFFEADGGAEVHLLWSAPGLPREVIPARRLFPGGGEDLHPTAVLSAQPTSGTAPLTVAFDGSASSDPEGGGVTHAWNFGDGATAVGAFAQHTYSSPGVYTARLSVTDVSGNTSQATRTITATDASGAQTLPLRSGRFSVVASWVDASDATGVAQARALSDESGYFWFFGPGNVELLVKVLDGCGFNNHFWVFAAGLTDVGVTLTVTDEVTGEARIYTNFVGDAFEPIVDTGAFATCGASLESLSTKSSDLELVAPFEPPRKCAGLDACLDSARYQVHATWRDAAGDSGVGTAVPLTDETAYFWFFSPDNAELVVKVLDGCGINGNRWVFVGGLTDVGVDVTITDTVSGAVWSASSPRGSAFPPVRDAAAFPCGG